MSIVLNPIIEFYRTILQPVQPLTWFGVTLTSLDLAASLRLCLVLRQIREQLHNAHVKQARAEARAVTVESRSFIREASAVLLVVYGGEALTGRCNSIRARGYSLNADTQHRSWGNHRRL